MISNLSKDTFKFDYQSLDLKLGIKSLVINNKKIKEN